MKLLLMVLISITLTGCSLFGGRTKAIEVVTEEQERLRLEIDLPAPLSLSSAEWMIVTPDNIESVWDKLATDRKHPVLFAITSEGYEQLSLTMAELRNYIATQRLIIIKYQEYYEPKDEQ